MNAVVFAHGGQELTTATSSRHPETAAANDCRKQEGELYMAALPKVAVS
jgi:hypothetical protein